MRKLIPCFFAAIVLIGCPNGLMNDFLGKIPESSIFQTASVDAVTLVAEFSKELHGAPAAEDFLVSGIIGNPTVTKAKVNGIFIILTLSSPAFYGENDIKLTYNRNGADAKQVFDSENTFLESFLDAPVQNNTGVPKT
ncbi:MAG: hypothetical protein LBV52_05850, partial [Spirochaetaceae bacterium]|nr:hypothetical protein [Spirochaetaceae bacterium]